MKVIIIPSKLPKCPRVLSQIKVTLPSFTFLFLILLNVKSAPIGIFKEYFGVCIKHIYEKLTDFGCTKMARMITEIDTIN